MSPDARPVLVVCGLAAEARIAAGPGTICVAAPPAALEAKLADLAVEPSAVVSFGLCGGLDPTLRAGALVHGTSVVCGDGSWACAPILSPHLKALESDLRIAVGPVAGADAPVLTIAAKAVLHAETKALAVDTESHVAAAYAARRGLPFTVLRAVCDTAASDLPPLAVRAIGPDGRLDRRAVAEELLRRPGQLFALPGTALGTVRAMRALGRARRLLGPRFGL